MLSRALHQHKLSRIDREIRTSAHFANNPITDIMRQFSQELYADHFSASALNRSAMSFKGGFSEVNITPDKRRRTLFIEAKGKFGKKLLNPSQTRRLSTIIKFISPMTDYGTYLNSNFTTSASNITYKGKMWINGNWHITGKNVLCVGGPVFVKGNISGNVTINGDLYYGGTKGSGIKVLGNSYNYFPLGDYPTINTAYYEAHHNVKFTKANEMTNEDSGWPDFGTRYVRLDFNSDGTITVNGGALPTITIPPGGLIIYGKNCNIRVSGTVRGKVTVVADRIKVRTKLVYANGTNFANINDSFAALAKNKMYWRATMSSGLRLQGVYFLDSTTQNILARGHSASGDTLELYGTRNRAIGLQHFTNNVLELTRF